MALTLGRGGRTRDRFGRLGAEFDDLAAEDAVALVMVAAGFRQGLADEADQPLADRGAGVCWRAMTKVGGSKRCVAALARALDASGRADDAMVATLAEDGDAALLVGLLARRAGIDPWMPGICSPAAKR